MQKTSIRVIAYEGKNRVNAIKKQSEGNLGYAAGFTRLIEYVNTLLPSNEVIQQALRKEVRMYPERAIRELIANALIHQDFDVSGRTRFNISDSNYPIASKILKETMEAGLVKPKDPDSKSKKHSQYVPFWA